MYLIMIEQEFLAESFGHPSFILAASQGGRLSDTNAQLLAQVDSEVAPFVLPTDDAEAAKPYKVQLFMFTLPPFQCSVYLS